MQLVQGLWFGLLIGAEGLLCTSDSSISQLFHELVQYPLNKSMILMLFQSYHTDWYDNELRPMHQQPGVQLQENLYWEATAVRDQLCWRAIYIINWGLFHEIVNEQVIAYYPVIISSNNVLWQKVRFLILMQLKLSPKTTCLERTYAQIEVLLYWVFSSIGRFSSF